jgi:putative phosphoribosyl transferase
MEIAMSAYFANRRDAGRQLAAALSAHGLQDPLVLALPRGGVPVALEVAKRLHAPLDVLFVRKIGAPGHEEYGIGALVDGASPQIVIDHEMAERVGASKAYIDRTVARELAEIERRRALYRTGPPHPIESRDVILVDDGIATGGTVRAALAALHQARAGHVVLAVPVAPRDVVTALGALCDEVVCLAMPEPFHAVGMHYVDFDQTSDKEVIASLAEANA